MLSISNVDLKNKRVIIRADLNIPIKDGHITDSTRITKALKTIRYIQENGGKPIVLSHLGRPQSTEYDSKYSLAPISECLSKHLNEPVHLIQDWINGFQYPETGIVLCENVRFQPGETQCDDALSKKMAALGDVFVMDAFGTAHRKHASTYGIAQYIPKACAGFLLLEEISHLEKVLKEPKRPLLAIVGGAKVAGKLELLNHLIEFVDTLIVGGGIANTFLAAHGFNIGKSLCENHLIKEAEKILSYASRVHKNLPLPSDVQVVSEITENARPTLKAISKLNNDDIIVDIGPETIHSYQNDIHQANTIIWNGPVGVFEIEAFSLGTYEVAKAVANNSGFSLAGGGDTLAALEKFKLKDKMSYISTGGGAFLEFLQGISLPGIDILK